MNALNEEKTVLLHGTSIEAVIHLLDTGVFDYNIKSYDTYQYQDYLFFAPNGRYFQNSTLGLDPRLCTWENAMINAEIYAKIVAENHYIQSAAGFRPHDIGEISEGWSEIIERSVLPEFKMHGLGREDLRQIMKESIKRKGVILGFNEKILEKHIESGRDEPEQEVCIYLPKGISIDYISAIQPIGSIETGIIKEYEMQNMLKGN